MGWKSVARKLLTLCGLRVTNTKRQRQASEEAARKIGKEFHKGLQAKFNILHAYMGPSLPGDYPHRRTGTLYNSLVTAVTANPSTGGYQIHTGFTPEFVAEQSGKKRMDLFTKNFDRKSPLNYLQEEYTFQVTSDQLAVDGIPVAIFDSREGG